MTPLDTIALLQALAQALDGVKARLGPRRWESFRGRLLAILLELERRGLAEGALDAWQSIDTLLEKYAVYDMLGRDEPSCTRSYGMPEGLDGNRRSIVDGERLLRTLTSKLGGALAYPPIEVYPATRVPDEVAVGEVFRVEVFALAAPAPGAMKRLALERRQPGPLDLVVELRLRPGLEPAGSTSAVLRIPEEGDSAGVVFTVVAREPGLHEITIELRQGVPVNWLHPRVRVAEQAKALSPAAAVPASAGPFEVPSNPSPCLSLGIDLPVGAGDHCYMRVNLGGDASILPAPCAGEVKLSANATDTLIQFAWKLKDCLGDPRSTTETYREGNLVDLGRELGDKLLPGSVARALCETLSRRGQGIPLHIVSDDAWMPWEAVALGDGLFLGDQFAVTRWLRSGALRYDLSDSPAILVAPPARDICVDRERASLGVAPGQELTRAEEVRARLQPSSGSIGLLHFACHGSAVSLDLGEQFWPVNVPRLPDGAERGPLVGSSVFLNACEAGTPARGLTGHGGWAECFLAAGAAVVVAPSWKVDSEIASRFASAFYDGLKKRSAVGEAARLARLAVRRPGDPDRLAYAVYASPGATLKLGAP